MDICVRGTDVAEAQFTAVLHARYHTAAVSTTGMPYLCIKLVTSLVACLLNSAHAHAASVSLTGVLLLTLCVLYCLLAHRAAAAGAAARVACSASSQHTASTSSGRYSYTDTLVHTQTPVLVLCMQAVVRSILYVCVYTQLDKACMRALA